MNRARSPGAVARVVGVETAATKPWWQMTRTPAAGFWIGSFWLLFSLIRWWSIGGGGWLGPTSAALFALLGVSYLASATAQLRRRHAPGTR